MPDREPNFSTTKRKPNPWVIALIAIIHIGLFYGLIRALAPGAVQSVERSVVSAFTVNITAPDDPPEPLPEPDAGAEGNPGEIAIAEPVVAPSPRQPIQSPSPLPRASSTGEAPASGARESGAGTGAAGSGAGTGSGRGGSGQGGGIARRPTVRSGELDTASDFPVPPGGRQTRFGKSVTVAFTVTAEGRARDCSVLRSSVDPQTTAMVCPLVVERIRFNPATRADGTPVEAPYGYRVDFKAR
ncbi:hypothetical protein MTsN3n11_17210 [Qipengyuania sp. MTN3-11]